jgi:hypothetical protein
MKLNELEDFPELGNTIVIDGIEYVKKREPLSIQEIYDLDKYSHQPFEIYTVRECISWIRKVEKAHGIGGGNE